MKNNDEKGLTNIEMNRNGRNRNNRKNLINGGKIGLINGNRRGLINGSSLINGEGLINGRGLINGEKGMYPDRVQISEIKIPRKKYPIKKIAGIIILIIILLISLPFIFIKIEKGIRIDGDFEDWKDIPKYRDSVADQADANINIVEYASYIDGSYASFYIKFEGTCLIGKDNTVDIIYIFIDYDGDETTGYNSENMGSDYVIEVAGWDNRVRACTIYKFDRDAKYNWNAKMSVGGVRAAVKNEMCEIQAYIREGEISTVKFVCKNSNGNEDIAGPVGIKVPTLFIKQKIPSKENLPLNEYSTALILTMKCTGGNTSVKSITLSIYGTVAPSDIEEIKFYSSSDYEIEGASTTDIGKKTKISFKNPLFIEDYGEISINIKVKLVEGAGKTIYIKISSPEDISIEKGVVSIDMPDVVHRYIFSQPPSMIVDGGFSDWKDVKKNIDPIHDVENKNIDLDEYANVVSNGDAYFYISVRGGVMSGTLVPSSKTRPSPAPSKPSPAPPPTPQPIEGLDEIYIFIDSDAKAKTGYQINGTGAEYMINVKGIYMSIQKSSIYKYMGDGRSWEWTELNDVSAEISEDNMEIKANVPDIQVGVSTYVIYTTDWTNTKDFTEISYVGDNGGRSIEYSYVKTFPNRESFTTNAPDIHDIGIIISLLSVILITGYIRRVSP